MQDQNLFKKFESDIAIVRYVKKCLEEKLEQYRNNGQHEYFFMTLREIQLCEESLRTLESIKQMAETITQGDTEDHESDKRHSKDVL